MSDVDAIDRGLRRVLAAGEALARRLGLPERDVPDELRRLPGVLRDAPVELRTRRFGDASWVLTLAEVVARDDGRLCAVTAVGVPRGGVAPILGVDLVALRGALGLIAVDLAPTDAAAWTAEAEPLLERLHRSTDGLVIPRRWPAFAAEVFSPRALIAGASRGHEAAVLAAIEAFLGAAASACAHAPASPDRVAAAAERARRWCLAERRNRREHDALASMFGAGPAAAYLEFLFPDDTPCERTRCP